MAKKKEKEFFPCVMEQKDCGACYNGICLALEKVALRDGVCPFYKSAAQQEAEDRKSLEHLVERKRFDLLQKYRGDKEAKNHGSK